MSDHVIEGDELRRPPRREDGWDERYVTSMGGVSITYFENGVVKRAYPGANVTFTFPDGHAEQFGIDSTPSYHSFSLGDSMTTRFIGRAFLALLLAGTFSASAQAQYFGRNKVQYEKFDWRILKTDHFDLYFYPAESLKVHDAGRQSEFLDLREEIQQLLFAEITDE